MGKMMKKAMGGYAMKAKSGKSFPDLTGDGKVTKADILKGRGVIKNGGKMKAKGGAALKKQAAIAMAMKAAGKKPKKARGGATLSPSKKSVSSNLGGYKRTIGKSMRNGGKMKMGGKCRGGCY